MRENLKVMVKSGVQLGTMWQFNGANNVFNDEGKMGTMIQEISKVNDAFRAAGLQDLSGVWE